MSFTLLSLLMPSENPTPPTKCTFFSSAASICQLKTVSEDVCTGLQGLRKQERISRLPPDWPRPQQSGQGILQDCGNCADMSFRFLHIPRAYFNQWLWKQEVELFQILQKRTLKFVKFLLL